MKTYYRVVNKDNTYGLNFKTHKEAMEFAREFSKDLKQAVEIKRYPVPYQTKQLLIVW